MIHNCFYNGRGKYLYMKQVLFGFFHGALVAWSFEQDLFQMYNKGHEFTLIQYLLVLS